MQTESSAPTIRQILFVGNELLSRQELEELLRIRAGEVYDETRLNAQLDAILRVYQTRGYAFATVTPQLMDLGNNQVQIVIVIAESSQVKFGDFEITGSRKLTPEALRKELKWRRGQPFNETSIAASIERVLQWYSEIGHPKVELQFKEVIYHPETGLVNFILEVDEGPEVRIGNIEIDGLQKTHPGVVKREISLVVGEVYDQRRVDAALRRLDRLGFFYSIDPVVLAEGETPDSVVFRPRVIEARTGRLNGILGYAPPEGENPGARLTGMLEAQENNLFGTGRKVRIFWKSGLLASYEISYEEPWIMGRRIHLGMALSGARQEDRWTEAVSRENGGSLSVRAGLSEWLQGTVSLTYKRIQLPDRNEDGSKYSLILNLEHDSRDAMLNPTRGRLDRITWEKATGDFQMHKLWIDLNQYWNTWPGQVIALGIHAGRAWGHQIPPTELFYLGGANTLRGYNEDWFRGPARIYTNLEYRFLVGRSSQFFLFLDTGAVSDIESPGRLGRMHLGYGLGMRLESKAGAISVDYGMAQDAGALEGKIHVSVAPAF